MNDQEEKKWLISRIDLFYHVIIEEFKTQSNKCEKIEQKITSLYTSKRNYCLSVLGILLTVLISVNPIYNIDVNIFSYILIGIFVSGVIIFCISSWFISKNKEICDFFHNNFLEAISLYSSSHGFMITNMAMLVDVTMKQAINYFIFSNVLHYVVCNKISKSSKEYAETYRKYPDLRKEIELVSEMYNVDHNTMSQLYEKLDKNEFLPTNILKYIEENLKSTITKNKS